MKRVDLAYLAGFFDGEGCISIGKHRNNGKDFYELHILVAQKSRWILEWFKFNFEGKIFKHKKPEGRQSEWFTWQVAAVKAASALKVLLPYLKLKKAEAELALKFQGQKGRIRLTEEERAVEEAQAIVMKDLKHK